MVGNSEWDASLSAAAAEITASRLRIPFGNVTTQLLSTQPPSPGRKLQMQTSLFMQVDVLSGVNTTGNVLAGFAQLGNDSAPAVVRPSFPAQSFRFSSRCGQLSATCALACLTLAHIIVQPPKRCT